LSAFDLSLLVLYLVGILLLGFFKRAKKGTSVADFIVGGRRLTLPAFVATLVCTWYGGILGVGEYTFKYGISNWLVFGVPYYLAAFLFAMFLAKKARRTEFLTIPDRLNQCYGKHAAGLGALVVFLKTLPAAYVLMLGVLCQQFFGVPFYVGILAGTLFSVVYVLLGGFRSVVRTDILQVSLMYFGFGVMLIILVLKFGGVGFLSANIPVDHFTWHGGNSGWFVAVWYVLALSTLAEPAFYQRCYAADKESTAKKGILISILFWLIFDFMTTSCGLYARALLPADIDPVSSFPALAEMVLPVGLYGLFAVALLATVMSTVDSYSFLAASTIGKDIICGWFGQPQEKVNFYTRIGLVISAVLAMAMAAFFQSVVDIWHDLGSVGTPMLLVPLFFSFVGRRRMKSGTVIVSMLLSGAISLLWLLSEQFTTDSNYWFNIEPIFPGLVVSILFYLLGSSTTVKPSPSIE